MTDYVPIENANGVVQNVATDTVSAGRTDERSFVIDCQNR